MKEPFGKKGEDLAMDSDQLSCGLQEIIKRFVPWTAHSMMGKPLSERRILGLGSLEGLYAIELARHEAWAVPVEVRKANIERSGL